MRRETHLLWIRGSSTNPSTSPDLQGFEDHLIRFAQGAEDGLLQLNAGPTDVVLAEFPISGWEPAELLDAVLQINPRIPVLICDPEGTVADAVRLVKLGAFHLLTSLTDREELSACLAGAAEQSRLRESANTAWSLDSENNHSFVGESRSMRDVEYIVRLAGPTRSTVLISGETGTGKEVVSRMLHRASPRAHMPLVGVNCSALPANLLEAELFGHVRGAFTGAIQQRVGRFEQAHHGTLFLDEIGEMPLELQAKLLRVLQEREFQRVGSSETVKVDVRIIAASNVDLRARVGQGQFREDLYYRLNVVPIEIPPLRERASDIPLLVHHFLEKLCRIEGIPVKRISREALDRLAAYSWPGNIRQLQNKVERAVVLSGTRGELCAADFPLANFDAGNKRLAALPAQPVFPETGLSFDDAVANFQRSLLQQAIRRSGGNKTLAADLLRMKRTTLLAKLRNLEAGNNLLVIQSA